MKVLVKIIGKSEVQMGVGVNGEWERMTLLGETMDDNPQTIPFDVFGKRLVRVAMNAAIGVTCEVVYVIKGREFEGRWFCNIEAKRFTFYVAAVTKSLPPASEEIN